MKHNLTIKNKQFGKYQVKGSKYFSFAFPVNDISKLKYFVVETDEKHQFEDIKFFNHSLS